MQKDESTTDLTQPTTVLGAALSRAIAYLGPALQVLRDDVMPKVTPFLVLLGSIDWDEVRRFLDGLPTESKIAMATAAEKGWFFGWTGSMEESIKLCTDIRTLEPGQIDPYMAAHFREDFSYLSDGLLQKYPARACAIGAAVRAHLRGSEDDFALSVPVFIAQADGLLSEILGGESVLQLAKQSGAVGTRAAKIINDLTISEHDRLLLGSIIDIHNNDLLKGARAREQSTVSSGECFSALNRHQVLHGEVSDYGTELNSLKAFSFLCYVGLHVPQFITPIPDIDTL